MYEYKFVPLYSGGGLWMNNSDCQHRTIIAEHAAQGWRFVGTVPTRFTGNGGTKEIDLVFERKANDD